MSLSRFALVKVTTPEIGDSPHQPIFFNFPKREFGKKVIVQRSFQSGWFKRWPWIHYDEGKDVAYCFHCIKAYKEGKLHSVGSIEAMFILKIYSNWKEAAPRFSSHETTSCINAHI